MIQNRFFPEMKGNFGFGCMRLPMRGEQVDQEQMNQMVDAFLGAGLNYFDTAHGYLNGQSEIALRECLVKRYPRQSYLLTNKLSTYFFEKEEDIIPLFESQLAACGVDYFDFYLMHAQDRTSFAKYKRLHAYEAGLKLREQGRIRRFGISFHDTAPVLDEILTQYPQVEVVQIQFNYADYENESVQSRKVYEVCVKHNKPVIVMEPVKGGSLANLPEAAANVLRALGGGSPASYAIRYAAGFDNMCMTLSGMSDLAQMQDNLSFMADFKPLDDREQAAVKTVCRIFNSMNMIPCTGCHYCVLDNDCPKHIQIPEVFACYNSKKIFNNFNQDFYYSAILTKENGKASHCIKCGDCEKICPQHLPIRKLLEDVAAEFEKEKTK